MSKKDWKMLCAYLNTGVTPEQVEELKKKKSGEPETTVYDCTDPEHDAYVCRKCGHIENFEADGPAENGWTFCPGCGRLIVAEDVTDLSDAPAEIKQKIIENHEKLTAAEAGNG